MSRDTRYEMILAVVQRIPRGRVAAYGQIAALAGLPRHARHVGFALRSLPDECDVPWHRVVGADGSISRRTTSDSHELQRLLLEAEGVEFSDSGRIDLDTYRWEPEDRPRGSGLRPRLAGRSSAPQDDSPPRNCRHSVKRR